MEIAKATDRIIYRPGLSAYTTPRGIRVLELDWYADPTHDEVWAAEARRLYETTRAWRREMERDWSSPAGEPFYPEYGEIGPEKFKHMMTKMIAGPVYRSFDFGVRRPAASWFQYSPRSDRVHWIREFMPHDLQTHEFRDCVRYLSGELEYALLTDRSKRWVDAYANKPSGAHCPPPWFPLGTRFINLSGKEALSRQANVPRPEESIAADIFREGGIPLIMVNLSVEGRHQILRRLLRVYEDGWPGLFVDPQVEEGDEALSGGLSYPKDTPANPVPTAPKDDGHLINLMDSFTYGVAGVVPADRPKPPKYRHTFRGPRNELVLLPDQEEIGFYETRPR